MCYFIYSFLFLTVTFLLYKGEKWFNTGLGSYTYKTKCPRCHGEATVEVYGSADQFEDTICTCGYTNSEVI